MSWGSGCRQHPRSPAQRSGLDPCAGVGSLLVNARRHPSAVQPGPKYPARRRQLREHRVCHGLPGAIGAGHAIVTERGHMTRSQPETSGVYRFGAIENVLAPRLGGAQNTCLCSTCGEHHDRSVAQLRHRGGATRNGWSLPGQHDRLADFVVSIEAGGVRSVRSRSARPRTAATPTGSCEQPADSTGSRSGRSRRDLRPGDFDRTDPGKAGVPE
jgi:hypothetical protein